MATVLKTPHIPNCRGQVDVKGQECVCMCECAPRCPRVCKEWTWGCKQESKQERSQWFSPTSVVRMQGAQWTVSSGDSNLQRRERKAHDSMSCLNSELVNAEMKRHLYSGGQTLLQRAQMRRVLWLSSLRSDATAAVGQEET